MPLDAVAVNAVAVDAVAVDAVAADSVDVAVADAAAAAVAAEDTAGFEHGERYRDAKVVTADAVDETFGIPLPRVRR